MLETYIDGVNNEFSFDGYTVAIIHVTLDPILLNYNLTKR